MSKEKDPEIEAGGQIFANEAFAAIATEVQTINNRGLRTLQREVNRNPRLVDRLGRFSNISQLTGQSAGIPSSIPIVGSLNSIATNLAVDVFSGGDARTMPSAQEMFRGIDRGNMIATAIAEELESCCKKIKRLLNRLSINLSKAKREILGGQNQLSRLITNRFRALRNEIINSYLSEKEKLKEYTNNLINEVTDNLIERFEESLSETENRLIERFSSELDSLERNLTHTLESELSSIKEDLNIRFSSLDRTTDATAVDVVGIATELTGLNLGFTAFATESLEAQATLLTTTIGDFSTTDLAIGGISKEIAVKSIMDTRKYNNHIDSKEKDLEIFSNKKLKEEHGFWNEKIESLPKSIAYEASLAIIGEPYYRYDAISCYYPTLTFIFYEVNAVQKRRRAQIKLRLLEKTEDLTDSLISTLKKKVSSSCNLSFMAGNTRANYVSVDKRMKTSIYAQDANNAKFILNEVLNIINDKFDENLLSITINGTSRPNLSKRTTAIGNVGLNTTNYSSSFEVKLHHAHLIVNGIKHLIPIWSDFS